MNGRQVNVFLFIAALVVFALVVINQIFKLTDKPQHTDITISSQSVSLFGRDTINALIREFEEQNPNLRIQVIPPDTQAAHGGADIVFFDDGEFGSLINAPYLRTEILVSFLDVFIYNIDILKAANYNRPPKTRAEFLVVARAIAGNSAGPPWMESVFPFALGLSPADPAALRRDFYPWVWVNGGDIHSTDLTRQMTDTITFFASLNREKLLAPGTFERTSAQRLEEFAKGRIAMITASMRDIAFLRQSGVNFDVTTIPAAVHGKNRLGLSNIYAGISGDCVLPEEASVFLAFIAEKSYVLAEALGAVPGSFPNAFSSEYIAKDPLYSKAWDIFQMADVVEHEAGQPLEEEINRVIREKLKETFGEH